MKSLQKIKTLSILLVLLILFVPIACSKTLGTARPETVGLSSDNLAGIDNIFNQAINQKRIKGVVAIVARNNKTVYHKAFGDMDDGKPMDKDAIFRICSMTKPITAVAVMKLWDAGRFQLDDPLYKYIPEFKDVKVLVNDKKEKKGYRLEPAKQPITIRQLLAQTSGISYGFWSRPVISQCYLDNDIPDGFRVAKGTIGEACKRLANCPLVFHPGEGWEYGLNFDVLGYFVEVVSGMPYDKYLEEEIFKPLKMTDTSFFVPEEKLSRLAALYQPSKQGGLKKLDNQVSEQGPFSPVKSMVYDPFFSYKGSKIYFSGGAGLHSTAKDYLRFCQMMLNRGELDGSRILKSKTVDLMIENQIGDYVMWIIPKGTKYGFSFSVITDNVSAGSSLPNGTYSWMGIYNTSFYIDPKHELIGATFSQLYPNMQNTDLGQNFQAQTQKAIIKE